MGQEKGVSRLSEEEIKKMKQALGTALEIYGKGDPKVKQDALYILNGWGRIIFVISNDGKRIGLELTERWEREREADKKEKPLHP
jgi:hypothetical protein